MPEWIFAVWPAMMGCLAIFTLARSLRSGIADCGVVVFEKVEEPANYWGFVILTVIVTCVCFWGALEIYRHPL